MNPNNSRTPGDGSKPGRTAGSQSWMTQMNDALGESDDENFLDFNLGPAFQSSHQRANSTSALATVAALPTAGINDRAQHGREMDRPLQMAGNQLLSFQPTYQPGQQVESQTPSSAFNPFGQAMVMSPRLSASTQPTTGTTDNTASQWNEDDEPAFWPSNDISQFFNMGTGAFEDASDSFLAINMEDTAFANSINYESTDFTNMNQTGFENLNADLVPITASPVNTNTSLATFNHFRTHSHASNTSSTSMGSDFPIFEPPESGLNEAATSNLLNGIFGPEFSADARGSRFQVPQYAMNIGSPGTTVTNSSESPRTPQHIHRRTQSANAISPTGAFQLAMHPTTMIRERINASPTRVGTIPPRQSPLRNSIEFTPPSPVPPGAPVKRKRGPRDKEEIERGLWKKRSHSRYPGSAPVTPSDRLVSSPRPTFSTVSTPKKPKSTRSPAVPYPKSWKTASSADSLLFELKNVGSTWDKITDTYNLLNHTRYTKSALQNRYHGIRRTIGDPPDFTPEEEMALPRHLDGFVLDAHGLHQLPYLNRLINGPPEEPDKAEDKDVGSDVDAEGETDPEA